jgi:hypothetical protein
MILPGEAGTRWYLSCLVMMLLLPGAMAFSVSPVSVSPPGVLNPGDQVNVSCTVYAASGAAFPSYDDLQLVTELDDPVWSYTIMVNGVENVRPAERGKTQTISGFELGYRNQDEVVVKVMLKASVPATAPPGVNKILLKVQELDARSYVIQNSVVRVDHLIGQPTPTPTPAFGSIAVTSDPAGASVYLDNAIRGITPVTLDGIPNGAHSILLRLDGYQDFTSPVPVMAGQKEVSAVLVPKTATAAPTLSQTAGASSAAGVPVNTQPAPGTTTGTLSVTTSPAGAIVNIDGQMKGITPTTIPGLSSGSHSVVIIMDGYEDFKTTTEIAPGTTSEFVTGLAKRKQAPGFAFTGAVAAVGLIAFMYTRMARRS